MTRFAFGNFSVDEATRALSRRGASIALTPRAFDTLLHLLQRSGELVGKRELMQAVWPSRVVEENNLNQAISVLRRVLEEPRGAHRYILTVPGRGYRFVAHVQTSSAEPTPARPLRTLAVTRLGLARERTGEAEEMVRRQPCHRGGMGCNKATCMSPHRSQAQEHCQGNQSMVLLYRGDEETIHASRLLFRAWNRSAAAQARDQLRKTLLVSLICVERVADRIDHR